MKIKTYVVETLTEAVEKIKQDLGPSAVILATKRKPAEWWNRTPMRLEVTAAVDYVAPEKPLFESKKTDPLAASLETVGDTVTLSSAALTPKAEIVKEEDGLVTICRDLLHQGVRPSTVQEMAETILAKAKKDGFEHVRDDAASWFLEHLAQPAPYTEGSPRRIALVGPTGSGKTTTLAKLASVLALDQKKSVAFLTLDHFRIGAEEQLKKYASILGVPCETVTDDSKFQETLERLSHHDVVLIDTTGRSPYDREGIEQTRDVLSRGGSIWTSLVLPVSLQGPELANAIARFATIPCQSLTLTKLDEATAFGSLVNAPQLSKLPLSYFTTGQKVPEDLEAATHERILDCLFNFSGHFGIPESLWDFQLPAVLKEGHA